MTITLELRPDVEKELLTQAHLRGVSLTEFAQEILTREAHSQMPDRTGQALIDVCAEVRGLLTDEEIDTMFARNCSLTVQSISLEFPASD